MKSNTREVEGRPISDDISALYEIIRSNPDPQHRLNAASFLVQLIDEGEEVDGGVINRLFQAEEEMEVATELKRILNKLKLMKLFSGDPLSPYDRNLSPKEETRLLAEIDQLKYAYDNYNEKPGAFDERYEFLREIGKGEMGVVYNYLRKEDKKTVAIKFLSLEKLSKDNDPERIIARFKREAGISIRLDHPNIIKGYENGEFNRQYYLVMEYVDGDILGARIKKEPLDLESFKIIGLQLLEALAYVHKNEIIHRDIKPNNVFLMKANKSIQAKLFDFGLAKDKKDDQLSRFAFQAGTDAYSSPEQLQDARNADEKSDLYSLGMTFYEMLTGILLEKADPFPELEVGDEIASGKINDLIKKCLSADRKDRWSSAQEVIRAFKEI